VRTHNKHWDVFISHASEDKEDAARPLAEILEFRYGLRVWLDDFELKAGDPLRRSIDHGLANSAFGVLIISKHFMSKRWPQDELAALSAHEDDRKKVILPIWRDVSAADVRNWSPLLADKVALNWADSLPSVARELVFAMRLPTGGLSGLWKGHSGRLRLRGAVGTYTPFEFYEGDYDWGGPWEGHLNGIFSRETNLLLFEWNWRDASTDGVGAFTVHSDGWMEGGWSSRAGSQTDNAKGSFGWSVRNESDFAALGEPIFEEVRRYGQAWSFSRQT
jgi:hypothetical protein